jgi:hypothetical protein
MANARRVVAIARQVAAQILLASDSAMLAQVRLQGYARAKRFRFGALPVREHIACVQVRDFQVRSQPDRFARRSQLRRDCPIRVRWPPRWTRRRRAVQAQARAKRLRSLEKSARRCSASEVVPDRPVLRRQLAGACNTGNASSGLVPAGRRATARPCGLRVGTDEFACKFSQSAMSPLRNRLCQADNRPAGGSAASRGQACNGHGTHSAATNDARASKNA